MAAYDSLVRALDGALDDLADDLVILRDRVAQNDQAVADAFGPLIERAQALGKDPADPVPGTPVETPETDPTVPADTGDAPSTDEPTA